LCKTCAECGAAEQVDIANEEAGVGIKRGGVVGGGFPTTPSSIGKTAKLEQNGCGLSQNGLSQNGYGPFACLLFKQRVLKLTVPVC
jgi:hypothetical protein